MSVAIRRCVTALTAVCVAGDLAAAVLHVRECLRVGNAVVDTTERSVSSGESFQTQKAPVIDGFVFTHWSIDADQAFASRDGWGRSLETASFKVYEDTVATANYMSADVDEDEDGVPDGLELYWYGDLEQDAASDTDGDGCPFLDELRLTRNPLFPEEKESGRILPLSSDDLLYNPHGYAPYVIRSEPEGALFETRRVYATPGESVETERFSPADSSFSYWTVNGRRAADAWGVASNAVAFVASDKVYMECVAHSAKDAIERNAGYWYGFAAAADSDVDGDGYTFGEELALGLSPVFADEVESGRVLALESSEVLFNPHGYVPYTIKSEPEGALFETVSDWRLPGEEVRTPQFDPRTTAFAYWTENGKRCQDEWGVAVDSVSFEAQSNAVSLVAVAEEDAWKRLSLYWYGDRAHGPDSDADDDGYTFRAEIERGLSPVFADELDGGRVLAFASESAEVSLQGFEQSRGAIVDGKYVELFASPMAGNGAASETFAKGSQIWPVVVDLNGDGLFDFVVASEGTVRVFVNVGRKGNPEFEENDELRIGNEELWRDTLSMNSTAKLVAMDLDVEPVGALSATVWGEDTLLVSDEAGRIWYFRNGVLQHKVWGGSYAGFANGLMLAAVDWDDDGDLDCLCGTAEGKLMLLRDPKVGRPTNLRALAGVDNVLLEWDPNAQSRVRGYKVYRSDVVEVEGGGGQWDNVASPSLPTYRDYPPEIRDYGYRVTSVSRFYTPGNSTPIVSESMPTEAVRASMGKVKFLWCDAAAFADEEIAVKLGVENSLNLSGEGLTIAVSYDAAKLKPVRVETSGLTEGLDLAQSAADGRWTVSAAGGKIAAGSGTFVSFVFTGLQAATSEVALVSAVLRSVGGQAVTPIKPEKNSRVEVWARQLETPTDPRFVGPYGKWDMNGDGWLTWEDRQLMSQLKQGGPNKKYTAEQLRAGDDNVNGELDNHDFQQMKADFDALGIKNEEGTEEEVEQ